MIKLNLGCGGDIREGWINVDITDWDHYNKRKQKIDVIANLKDKLPFQENYADYILLQECFEHFNRWDAFELLKEMYRILKVGGTLELTVPPAEQQLKLLLTQFNKPTNLNDFLDAHQRPYNIWKAIDDLCGATWQTFQNGKDLGDFPSHKCFYSKEMLKMLFTSTGFTIDKIDNSIRVFARK